MPIATRRQLRTAAHERPSPGRPRRRARGPARRGAPGGRVRRDRDALRIPAVRSMPAGHPPPLPSARLGVGRRQQQGLHRQDRPVPESREVATHSRGRAGRPVTLTGPEMRKRSGSPWAGSFAANSRPAADATSRARRWERPTPASTRRRTATAATEKGLTSTSATSSYVARPALQEAGEISYPREAQIAHLKAQNAELKDRAADRDATIEELQKLPLSRLTAQHDEMMRMCMRSPQSSPEPPPPAKLANVPRTRITVIASYS